MGPDPNGLELGGVAKDGSPPATRERRGFVYGLFWWLVRLYVDVVYRPDRSGLEHVPATGGALLVANHQSVLDIMLLGTSLRRPVGFVARKSLDQSRFLGWVMRHCHVIGIERGSADRAALVAMCRRLEAGGLVAIFPEGTRSAGGRVRTFRRGAQVAARRAGVPVIPIGVRNTGRAWPRERTAPPLLGRRRLGVGLSVAPALAAGAADGDSLERLREQVARLAQAELSSDAGSAGEPG